MYKYYLIILNSSSSHNSCCGSGQINYLHRIIAASIFGYAKLTDSSIILKSNQDIGYWKKFMEDLNCSAYFITTIDITNDVWGRSDSKTWEWLKVNKEEELSNRCTFKLVGCNS